MEDSGNLPTFPSPNPILSLTSSLGQNVGLGRGGWADFRGLFQTTLPTYVVRVAVFNICKQCWHNISLYWEGSVNSPSCLSALPQERLCGRLMAPSKNQNWQATPVILKMKY